jgi:hypothetical protein
MAGKRNDLSEQYGPSLRKISQGVLCVDCEWWFHWECASNLDSSKPWCCVSCKQATLIKQIETVLNLRSLAVADKLFV